MVKKVILGIIGLTGVALLAVLLVALTKPDVLHVERATIVAASPEKIFPYLNNFRKWKIWSPWDEKDPSMKKTFRGPVEGVGAKYSWRGNDEVGEGTIEITKVVEPSLLCLRLQFEGPFGPNDVVYTLKPVAEGTKVNWSMEGKVSFMCKLMQVFINLEEMCGKDFERGLTKLKKAVEATPTDR